MSTSKDIILWWYVLYLIFLWTNGNHNILKMRHYCIHLVNCVVVRWHSRNKLAHSRFFLFEKSTERGQQLHICKKASTVPSVESNPDVTATAETAFFRVCHLGITIAKIIGLATTIVCLVGRWCCKKVWVLPEQLEVVLKWVHIGMKVIAQIVLSHF